MASLQEIRLWPKIELHCHLDCSVGFDVFRQLDHAIDRHHFERDIALNESCNGLSDFLTRIPRSLEVLQQQKVLAATVDSLIRQLIDDGVVYAEIRFAPLLHLEGGMTAEEVVATVLSRFEQCAPKSLHWGIILCTLRHFSRDQGMRTVALAEQFRHRGVVGLDLAADEAGFPITNHIDPFRYAQKIGLKRTAHAGEALGPESIRETIDQLQPHRIGHGVRAIEDPLLVRQLAASQVHLEVCPSCNVMIGVFPDITAHSVDTLYREGVSLGINTDGRTIPLLTLSGEYWALQETFGWQEADFRQANLAALEHAFCGNIQRAAIRECLSEP